LRVQISSKIAARRSKSCFRKILWLNSKSLLKAQAGKLSRKVMKKLREVKKFSS